MLSGRLIRTWAALGFLTAPALAPHHSRAGTGALPLTAADKDAAEAPKTAQEWIARGELHFKANRLEQAVEAFNEAIKLEPTAKAYQGRAAVRLYQRDWDKALADGEEAVRRSPFSAECRALRAAIRLGKNEEDDKGKELDQIKADMDAALKLDPKLAYAHAVRASYFNVKENPDLALAAAEEAIRLDPLLADPYLTLSRLHAKKEEWDKAILMCDKAIKLDPYNYSAFNNRSWAYGVKEDFDKAIADASRSLDLCPRNFWAYNNRASAYRDKGDRTRALADLKEAMRIAPNKSVTFNLAAGVALGQKDYPQCIEFANRAIENNPKNAYAWNNRGAAYSWLKNYAQAVKDYSEAIRLKPDFAKAYQNRALSLQSLGRRPEANEDLALYEKLKKASAIPTGKELTDRAAGFSVWMPGEYQKQERTTQLAFAKMNSVAYGVYDSNSGYSALGSLNEYPRDPSLKDSDRFSNALDAELASTKGKLLGEKEITLGTYPGREYRIEVEDIGELRVRIYLAKQRVYIVRVLGSKAFTTSPIAEKFFGSFKIPG